MKGTFLLWAGGALLISLALANWVNFFGGFKSGILIGAALVVFGVYPAYIRNLERRLSALERAEPRA